MTTYLSANFTLEEFQAVSDVRLTPLHELRAQYFAGVILQPLRREFGWPIKLTSFVRAQDTGDVHENGDGLDFQPCRNCPEPPDATEFARRLETMFQWLAKYKAAEFGTLIDERNHLHITRPGSQGRVGYVLREPTEGSYVLANIAPVLAGSAGLVLAGVALWALSRKG